ncbi:MAG: metal ABC transporter substrate-binding protein [Bacilli bacterium]|nr:metal ABC transporter substrate-binding protein [Bacilli bacterium]
MKLKKFLTTLTIFAILLCSGCKPSTPSVSVSVYPIQYLVERIGGSYVKVDSISQNGAIQSASIKENFRKQLKKNKVLFYIQELEPYFDVYSSDIRTSDVDLVDLASKSVFYKFQRYTTTYSDGQTVALESSYYEGDAFKNVDTYKDDPMIWMDPISMISSAEIIRDYLIEQYPEYQTAFENNYKELELDLTRLDVEFQKLKNVNNEIAFVSLTPSFGAWQKSYGIKVYPVCLSKYGALPTNEQLAIIKQRIINDGVKYIAYESNLNDEMKQLYDSLKEELGLIEVNISNLSSLSSDEKKENKDYLTIMYENLASLEVIANSIQ